MTPDVSVVVISYNDAARLPRAIRSVQRQTLRSLEIIVVDDASSDETADVVRRLAQDDPRIRYERLAENSGGCSAPRNRGIDLATAPWVMFCDSDDEYERHACKNLLEAAEDTRADIVCGTAERVDVTTGNAKRWRPELHERMLVADGLGDIPDLLYDTISVNKIYRLDLLRRAGIRFPEGLLFEDQLFTLEAMAAATRVAVIPQTVYYWSVDRVSDEPSITQRRHEARNVESRVEINRRIDDFLARHPDPRLRRQKDRKFLRHDLYLYLSSMLEISDDEATVLMDSLVPYVSVVDVSAAWELRPGLRVAIYHLLQRDLAGVRAAMRMVRWASVVDRPIVGVDGREFWGCRHLESGPPARGIDAQRWLDVTELGLLDTPFTQRRYLHRVGRLDVVGTRVVLEGESVDYDGHLATCTGLELRLEAPGGRVAARIPAQWIPDSGTSLRWRAEGELTPGDTPLTATDRGSLVLAVDNGGRVNATAVRSDQVESVELPGPAGTTLRVSPGASGGLAWRTTRGGTEPPAQTGSVTRVWRGLRIRLVRAVAALLPSRRVVVVDAGRTSDPAVVRVSAALREVAPDVDQVWVRREGATGIPSDVTTVDRGSVGYAWVQARAAARLEGEGAEVASGFRRDGVLMLLAAAPVHRVGLDDPEVLTSRSSVASIRRRGRTLTVLGVSAPHAGEVLAPALATRAEVEVVGLPAMDAVLALPDRMELRQQLDLPTDRAVVLHLPLPRGGVQVDLDAWESRLRQRVYLVLAPGGSTVPTRLRHAVRGLASHEDIRAVLAACDLVVSDYSPRIADAVLAGRPVVLYQPDREVFLARTCGVYPGLESVGPVVSGQGALHDEVEAWCADPSAWDQRWAASRREWGQTWAGQDDGASGERAARALVRAMRGGG